MKALTGQQQLSVFQWSSKCHRLRKLFDGGKPGYRVIGSPLRGEVRVVSRRERVPLLEGGTARRQRSDWLSRDGVHSLSHATDWARIVGPLD